MNTTVPTNATQDAAESRNAVATIPVLALLILTTCLANILVIACIKKEKRLRTISNMYVASLAAADLLVGLVVMNGMVFYTVYGYWPLGEVLCTIWVSLDFSCCTVSMLHLCLIGYDRYKAIVHPLAYRFSRQKKQAMFNITAVWLIGILAWVPAIISIRKHSPSQPGDCFFIPNRLYILLQSIFVYFLPIIAMIFFYIRCLYALYVRGRNMISDARLQTHPDTSQPGIATVSKSLEQGNRVEITNELSASTVEATTAGGWTEGERSIRRSTNQREQHKRCLRTLGAVMLMFLVCWLPFCLLWPITAYCDTCVPTWLLELSYWSAYINSTLNPMLYFITNKDFRFALKRIMCRKKSTPDNAGRTQCTRCTVD